MRAILLISVIAATAACYEDTTELGRPSLFRAYAAERVQHCPVPFFTVHAGITQMYDGADLLLFDSGRVELTFFLRSGNDAEPIHWQADTLRVAGTYERDGFTIRFHFDEGYRRPVPMIADLVEDGRLTAAFPDGGQMEFVPMEQRPTDPPGECDP